MFKKSLDRKAKAGIFLASILIAMAWILLLPIKYSLNIHVVNPSRNDDFRVFYDTGKGFNDADSKTTSISPVASDIPNSSTGVAIISLPAQKIEGLKIVPGGGPKTWHLKSIILKNSLGGFVLRSHTWLPEDIARDFTPLHAIDTFRTQDKQLLLNASGNDSYFGYKDDFRKVQGPLRKTARYLRVTTWITAVVLAFFLMLLYARAATAFFMKPFLFTKGVQGVAPKENIPVLTGFRALAAYSVLLAHALDVSFSYSGSPSPFRLYTVGLAYFGMTTFFVLSGFVIAYNYSDLFASNKWGPAFAKFLIARFARLYPLYLVFLLVSIGALWKSLFANNIFGLISFLTLTQSWFNLQMITFPPAWSISTEAFFYLIFALLALVPFRVRTSVGRLLATATLLVGILLFLYLVWSHSAGVIRRLGPLFSNPSSPDVWGWLTYFSPYVRIFEFFLGMCSAWLFMSSSGTGNAPKRVPFHAYIVTALCLIGIVFMFCVRIIPSLAHPFLVFLTTNFGFAPFLACLFYYSCRYDLHISKFFASRPAVFCGEISYSVYIIQFHVYSLFPAFISSGPSLEAYATSSIRVIFFVAFTTVFSYGSLLLIEKPARNMLRNVLTGLFSPTSYVTTRL